MERNPADEHEIEIERQDSRTDVWSLITSALGTKADCPNCEYTRLNDERSGQHCYMFADPPGLTCGQFKRRK